MDMENLLELVSAGWEVTFSRGAGPHPALEVQAFLNLGAGKSWSAKRLISASLIDAPSFSNEKVIDRELELIRFEAGKNGLPGGLELTTTSRVQAPSLRSPLDKLDAEYPPFP